MLDKMIIDSSNPTQRSILTNKCYFQTIAMIMLQFEEAGYANPADEALNVIKTYHDLMRKKSKNTYNAEYNVAFKKLDDAIKQMANLVFYQFDNKSYDVAYKNFAEFDYVNAIISRQRLKNIA